MNARASLLGTWLLLGLASLVIVPACGGSDTTADDDDDNGDDDQTSSSSGGSSGKASSSSGGKSSSSSSGGGSSGGPSSDASTDDAGEEPVNPNPGDACVTVGHAFPRACGTCGTQLAYCTQSHVVGGYGACNEPPSGCTDGGPIADAGGSSSSGGTPDSGTPDAGGGGIPTLVLGTTVNATSAVLTTIQGTARRINASSERLACPLTLRAAGDGDANYAYVTIQNPNNKAATIDLTATGDGDSFVAVYATQPQNDAARAACVGFYDQATCGDGYGPGCLDGAESPIVPANGSVVAFLGAWSQLSTWEADAGLQAKVTALTP